MPLRHPFKQNWPLPQLWLISDGRNDAVLERALRRLPRGAGFIFRHYHLPAPQRRARWHQLAVIARARGLVAILAGTPALARWWGADGCYGPAAAGCGLIHLATVHSLREIGRANRARADAVLLSPVYPTRSHPGAAALGPVRFRLLAARAAMPVIALGGMGRRGAARLGGGRWAAIDGLS